MKAFLKSILRPVWNKTARFREEIKLVKIFIYDYRRYRKYYVSSLSNKDGKDEIASWLLQDKHRIEKALSLPHIRENFGEAVLTRLLSNAKKYNSQYGKDDTYYWAIGAFKAYKAYHLSEGIDLTDWFNRLYCQIPKADLDHYATNQVGVKCSQKPQISNLEFKQFFESRVSTRCFNREKLIDERVLEQIVSIAIKTPSVCNRQHWKAHIVSGEMKSRVLKLQNGNAGFGSDAPNVAIITSSLKAFYLPAERVQAYADGGMFAMSFILGCHAYGIASCALNWAASLEQDIRIRELGIIGDDEVVVMLIALGYEVENAQVANSPRKNVKEVLSFVR